MVAGHLQEKKGFFYIVLSYKDADGKRKTKWIATNLPLKGNKKRAEALLMEARKSFVLPEIASEEKMAAPQPHDMLFTDWLEKWLRVAKGTVKLTTYASYAALMKASITPYFLEKGFTLKTLTAQDIQDFYTAQLDRVSANTVIHYHAIIHRALKHAVRMDILESNPADKVERPKKEKYLADYYTSDEVELLFERIEGHPLELAIRMGAFYGLRRAEILGLKWNAIDFKKNTITIQHTVTSCNVDGKHMEIASDTAKTKSSLRTLPLVEGIRELLLQKQQEQEYYRKLSGRSYCKDYLDYIFVNQLGERMKPNYISAGFKRILQQNDLRVIRLHDLRHSSASLLIGKGIPMKQVQEWLGHSDFSTTANIYAHLEFHSKLASADALVEVLHMSAPKPPQFSLGA